MKQIERNNIVCVAEIPVYINYHDTCGNPYTLTPYMTTDREIWLAADGNGCGDDICVNDLGGWSDEEIVREYGEIDTAAMWDFARGIHEVDEDAGDWLADWCDTVEQAKTRITAENSNDE